MADASDIVLFHAEHENLDASLKAIVFDPDKLQEAGLITRQTQGRGTTYFYRLNKQPVVLRHYWRGGFIQNLSKDAYLWLGLEATRSHREWCLLQHLETLGLPAPRSVALRIQRKGLCYRSDIVTEEIEGVESLANILRHRPATSTEWALVGQTIRRFHDQQIHHPDLNASNLLLNEEACHVIDFDRGRIHAGEGWKDSVIARLRRSLEKLSGKHTTFHMSEDGWKELLAAYHG